MPAGSPGLNLDGDAERPSKLLHPGVLRGRRRSPRRFCKKAIAKAADPDPDRRFKTADDFLNELEAGLKAWLKLVGKKPRTPGEIVSIDGPDRWRAWVSIGLGVILFLGLGLGLGLWYSRRRPQLPPPPIVYQGECDVHVTQRGELKLDPRPVLGGATESLRDDEMVYITANLTKPPSAYFYVLQIDSRETGEGDLSRGLGPRPLAADRDRAGRFAHPPRGRDADGSRGAPGTGDFDLVRAAGPTHDGGQRPALGSLYRQRSSPGYKPKKFDKSFPTSPLRQRRADSTKVRGFNPNPDVVVVGKDPVSQTERILLTLKDHKVAAYSRAICYPFVAAPAASANP